MNSAEHVIIYRITIIGNVHFRTRTLLLLLATAASFFLFPPIAPPVHVVHSFFSFQCLFRRGKAGSRVYLVFNAELRWCCHVNVDGQTILFPTLFRNRARIVCTCFKNILNRVKISHKYIYAKTHLIRVYRCADVKWITLQACTNQYSISQLNNIPN